MEKLKCYGKCYGGYILAVGAGCCFSCSLLLGLGLLAAAGFRAYKVTCCCKHSRACKK